MFQPFPEFDNVYSKTNFSELTTTTRLLSAPFSDLTQGARKSQNLWNVNFRRILSLFDDFHVQFQGVMSPIETWTMLFCRHWETDACRSKYTARVWCYCASPYVTFYSSKGNYNLEQEVEWRSNTQCLSKVWSIHRLCYGTSQDVTNDKNSSRTIHIWTEKINVAFQT